MNIGQLLRRLVDRGVADRQVDVDEVRARFPWVGLASIDEPELSVGYREIQSVRTRASN